ncbi:MAG TPA: DUF6504 family protein [Frankiaceae bacterium]|nr:DUF6504 family protein [Frankiaceae bacterium]
MGRRHAEPIDVRRRDDAPAQFLWRSRLYVVKDVLEHWFESGQWWASVSAMALGTGSDAQPTKSTRSARSTGSDLVLAPIPASPKWAQRAWGEPAPDVGASMGPASIDDGEQEFWRVEAAAGRSASPGIYDLCFLWSLGSWQLVEVHD